MEQTALWGIFNEDPANYDRYRPRYMPELFETIFAYGEKAGCSRGKALEMGSGTGQATEPFLRAGWQVTAVEMGDNLASFAREKFRDQPGLKVVCGDFLTAPLEGPYDLFYAATSFHWVGTKEAFPRIQSLLKPGGVVALFWNHPCPGKPGTPEYDAIQQVYGKYRGERVQTHLGISQEDAASKVRCLEVWGFTQVEARVFHGVRRLTAQEYVGLMNTYSDHRAMEEKARLALEHDMEEAIEALGGVLPVYDTVDLYLARNP